MAAETQSAALNQSPARLARIAMYGQGRCVAVLLEGPGRAGRVDDLTAFLFECCRFVPELRASIAGDTSEPTRIFVGDNCRSLTMPMSDAVVSRSASLAGLQLERWLVGGLPKEATLCAGVSDAEGLGMAWTRASLGPTTVLDVADDGGWNIRILHPVVQAIHADALRWGSLWKQAEPWSAASRLKIEPSPLRASWMRRLTAFERPPASSSERMGLFKICARQMEPLWGISPSSELGTATRKAAHIRA
jgi:hypothetical protein